MKVFFLYNIKLARLTSIIKTSEMREREREREREIIYNYINN